MPEPPTPPRPSAPRWGRRGVLRLAAALPLAALVACSRRGEAGPEASTPAATSTATPVVTPSPTPTASPTPAAPVALTLELLPPTLGVGEAMRVRVPLPPSAGATSGVLRLGGREYALARLPDGALWGVVGASLDATPGEGLPLTVVALAADGRTVGSAEAQTSIVAVPRPVERLYVTEEQGAVLGGDAGPREIAIRGVQFSAFDPVAPRWPGCSSGRLPGQSRQTSAGRVRSTTGRPGPATPVPTSRRTRARRYASRRRAEWPGRTRCRSAATRCSSITAQG